MAQEYSPHIRVNAIAPGFYLTEQNRFFLLLDTEGKRTPCGQAITSHTPAGRLGKPADWLASPASAFVTSAVVRWMAASPPGMAQLVSQQRVGENNNDR
ncbi:MAG TPA: hypothetical protein VFN35_14445 [Ktedonobacteraceae bacterium]|nr:hypothetical protein [Ktedonobacteraceae bacterium]